MKRNLYRHFILSMIGILVLSMLKAQPAGFLFKKAFGGSNHDNVVTTKQTLDGGFVLGGVTSSKDGDVKNAKGGSSDVWIVKLNSAGSMQWQKCLGGSNGDIGTIVHELKAYKNGQLQNDGYIVGATTSSANGDVKGYKGGTSDIWVVRLSATGSILWQRTIGGTGKDEIVSLKPVNDGSFIVAGNTQSSDGDVSGFHGSTDVLVVKLSAAGVPVWRKTLGNSGYEGMQDLQVLDDGSAVILSRISQANPGGDITDYRGNADYWVCRVSNAGTLAWQKTLGGSGNENTWSMLRRTADGQLLVCGSTTSGDGDLAGLKNNENLSFWVVKLNQVSGNIIWNWAENSGGGHMLGMNHTSDGGFIFSGGGYDGDQSTPPGGKVIKLTADGIMQWSKDFGYTSGSSEFFAVQETANGDFIGLGNTLSKDAPGMHSLNDTTRYLDFWVVRMNNSGEKVWDQAYGGKGTEGYGCVLPTIVEQNPPLTIINYWDDFLDANDNIFAALNTNSNDGDVTGLHAKFGNRSDIWFVRLNTGSAGLQTNEVRAFTTIYAYPNPFKRSTVISFQPPEDAPVVLKMYNSQGSLVKEQRVNNVLAGRMNTIHIELNNYSQGLYYYTVVQGNYIGKGKLVLQR